MPQFFAELAAFLVLMGILYGIIYGYYRLEQYLLLREEERRDKMKVYQEALDNFREKIRDMPDFFGEECRDCVGTIEDCKLCDKNTS